MKALTRLTAVIFTGIGGLLVGHFLIQHGPCDTWYLKNSYCCKSYHTAHAEKLLLDNHNHFHVASDHGYCTSNDPMIGEGIAQLIDLEDEWVLVHAQNILEATVSSSGDISKGHYVTKVTSSSLPLYLLKSSFLL